MSVLQGELSNARGGPFAVVNGAMAEDVLVVAVPARARIERPLYVVNISTAAAAGVGGERVLSASAPRLLIALGKGAEAEVVEEYVSAVEGASDHAVFSVAEVVLDACASLRHGYVQRESPGSVHFKATLVDQGEGSAYSLVEARVGGGLSRHDVGVDQDGAETSTRMRHFLLAGVSQLQDLHTKLVLDHPRGEANQLHKCIVSAASGRGVFDGNVKVGAARVCHAGLVSTACDTFCAARFALGSLSLALSPLLSLYVCSCWWRRVRGRTHVSLCAYVCVRACVRAYRGLCAFVHEVKRVGVEMNTEEGEKG